jgi:hypothetical protein
MALLSILVLVVFLTTITYHQQTDQLPQPIVITRDDYVVSLGWCQTPKQLILGTIDGVLLVYDPETEALRRVRTARSTIASIAVTRGGNMVALAVDESRVVETTAGSVRIARVPSKSTFQIQLWDGWVQHKRASIRWHEGIDTVSFSPDDKKL